MDDNQFSPEFAEVLWFLFDDQEIPDMLKRHGNLKKFFETLRIKPVKVISTEGNSLIEKIFEARYEILKYKIKPEKAQYPDAYKKFEGEPDGFIDFVTGFPYEVVEIMAVYFEESSLNQAPWVKQADPSDPTPPIPDSLFEGPSPIDIIHNYTAIPSPNVEHMAENLKGEKEPQMLWWTRRSIYQLKEDGTPYKRPIPGEFVVLSVRIMPDKYWGEQHTSPFFFSGNWIDTLYYTSGVIEEILEPNDKRPYKLYKVRWRSNSDGGSEDDVFHLARPSGFEEYEVGERVAILKDANTDRVSQTWKDDTEFVPNLWRIIPVTFYKEIE